MLVLTRRTGEQVQLGADIRVTVVRISDGSVRIGIEAPRGVSVMRQELLDASANKCAAANYCGDVPAP